ncbi:hypothetical protein ACFL4N_09730 [Thermodesulfobacteriota bacterium]
MLKSLAMEGRAICVADPKKGLMKELKVAMKSADLLLTVPSIGVFLAWSFGKWTDLKKLRIEDNSKIRGLQ